MSDFPVRRGRYARDSATCGASRSCGRRCCWSPSSPPSGSTSSSCCRSWPATSSVATPVSTGCCSPRWPAGRWSARSWRPPGLGPVAHSSSARRAPSRCWPCRPPSTSNWRTPPLDNGHSVIAMSVAEMVEQILGTDLPVAFEAYDGSRCGPVDAPTTIVLRSPTALQRILTAPGELGFGRAYVAGDLDVEGDIWAALSLRDRMPSVSLEPKQMLAVLRLLGAAGLRRPTPPPEEIRLHGRRHSKSRDAAAIAHHYDVSNEFYALVLGPTMTYSCGVWADRSITLDQAQE